MFNVRRSTPTPRMAWDDYYRFAVVPGREQHQAGVKLALGTVGNLSSPARLQRVMVNGMPDYRLVFKEGV